MDATQRQNADLTYRHNRDQGRHGWLRLTPAYSVKLVREVVAGLPRRSRVLDPFSGTGTTPLAACEQGHHGVSVELNPFLVWLGNTKLRNVSSEQLAEFERHAAQLHSRARRRNYRGCDPPPIHNLERWWDPVAVEFLCKLRRALDNLDPGPTRDLLQVAFCRTVIESSAAAFNHQSMSFKNPADDATDADRLGDSFRCHCARIHDSASRRLPGKGSVLSGDSRTLMPLRRRKPFDAVVTSPPYVNRMSYVRELRPYMYWTGFLQEAREAGELDWKAIGGTWGVATSRLKDWEPSEGIPVPAVVGHWVRAIARSEHKHAHLMAAYVAKYFEDMSRHVGALAPHVRSGGEVHYVVGNSKFYDVLVQAQDVYAELFRTHGFERVEVRTLRKRNSKKELYEYDVTGVRG